MIGQVKEQYRQGNLTGAETLCREILKHEPNSDEAFYFLGLISLQRKEYNSAREYFQKALYYNPKSADALNNLGIILQNSGQPAEAVGRYEEAVRLQPNFVLAYFNMGSALQAMGNLPGAEECFQKIISLNPQFTEAYLRLGFLSQRRGEFAKAVTYYKKAIVLNPYSVESHYMLAMTFQEQGATQKAIELYRKTIALDPLHIDAYNNLGVAFQNQKQFEQAIQCFQKALELNPEYAQSYNNLGNTFRDLGEWDRAIESYENAVKIKPEYSLAYYNLGNILYYQGRSNEAVVSYTRAVEADPHFVTARWAKCMSQLPIVYDDEKSIHIARKRYSEELISLRESVLLDNYRNVEAWAEAVGRHQPFLLACQGLDDRELQQSYGDFVCTIMARRYPQFSESPRMPLRSVGEPIRIGIVSAHFHFHSVWKIPLRGWVDHLDKEKFQLYGYHTGQQKDLATASSRNQCYRFVENMYSFEGLCHTIRDDSLHVLIYPELGMDMTALKLASLRLSPVQCVSLGHPETTGLPTIDYYLSSDLMEPYGAEEHYTERLVRLPHLGFYYESFSVPPVQAERETFGLRKEAVVFLCSHSLFTYLPQYDEVFPRIAREVDNCQFVFIAHSYIDSPVTQKFRLRIKRVFNRFHIDDEKHITFLPQLDPGNYHALNSLSDIFLDSIGWSANNSTFEALACNLPVVTFPGKFMRQRHCAGILSMLGLHETIVYSLEEYIAIAVRLANDSEWRQIIRSYITSNKDCIYRDNTALRALEKFLENIVQERIET